MTQTDFLIWITEHQHPLLDKLAYLLTFMGDAEFYLLILPLIYWCFSKTVGFRLLYLFIISIYINSLLKFTVSVSRPVGVDGVHSLFIESAEVGSHYPHDSFPSGHAQGSTTLWGYLAIIISKPAFWVLAVALIFLISLSRLYTGLHWPIDVVSGILIAIIILVAGTKIEEKLVHLPRKLQWLLAIIVPIFLVFLFPQPEGYKYSGFLLGAGIAYLMEGKYVQLNLKTAIWKKAFAYLIGMIGIVGLQVGLKWLLPSIAISDFIRYGGMAMWALLGAPWLFIKLGLYPTDRHIKTNQPRPPVSA
jgi:membrane-associated phospholipid phosphatase